MTFGFVHAVASLLALLDHVQERFLQEIRVLALDAWFITPASNAHDQERNRSTWLHLLGVLGSVWVTTQLDTSFLDMAMLGLLLGTLCNSNANVCAIASSWLAHLASSSFRHGSFLPSACRPASSLLVSWHVSQSFLIVVTFFRFSSSSLIFVTFWQSCYAPTYKW